jgi:two-component system sensor histidine kinase FlrB
MTDREEFLALKKTFEEFIQSSAALQDSYNSLKNESQQLSLYLSNILENLTSAILVFDTHERIILWNSRAILYFPQLKNLIPPIDQNLLNHNSIIDIQSIFQSGQKNTEVTPTIHNELCYLDLHLTDFFDHKKNKIGYILMLTDQTELRKLQIRSQQEDRLRVMGELAAEVAHEIRNPLGSIELMVGLLENDKNTAVSSHEILSRIRSAVNTMNHTVTNTLLYTKELQLKKTRLQLVDLIEQSMTNALDLIRKKNISINTDIQTDWLKADWELLKQSLANIIINATQAVDHFGKIEITVKTDSKHCIIGIWNNGPKISPEILDKIFNPFFTTKNTGTGLGLAMVKRIIEAHHGQIEVKSNQSGTLFSLLIPLE